MAGEALLDFLKPLAERLGLLVREGVERFHDGLPLRKAQLLADVREVMDRDREGAVHVKHPVAALEDVGHLNRQDW